MSPEKRRDRKGKRRRAWAAPFVVTMALSAPACVVKEAEPQQPQPPTTSRDHRDGQQDTTPPTTISNPPPPEQPTEKPAEQPTPEKPTVISNPPPPNALPAAPTSGGTLVTRKDGTCWWHVDVECPENATCNPPPPKQVQCREDK